MARSNHQSIIDFPLSSVPTKTEPRVRGSLCYLPEEAALNLRLEGPISTLHLVHYVSKAFDAIPQYPLYQWSVDLRHCDKVPDSGRFWALLQLMQHKNLRKVLGTLDKIIVVRDPGLHRPIDDVLGPIFHRLTKTHIVEAPVHPFEGAQGELIL